jgi:hypothetical protein
MQKDEALLVSPEMLAGLPEPIQRYMHYTKALGKPWIHSVRLTQTGRFRMAANRPWMPMRATQSYTTQPPSFRWDARFRLFGFPLLKALDEYKEGHGQMRGKIAGIYTLFDQRGDELDQGALMRYLSEMIWFPIAFLGENISWEAIDEGCAKVALTDGEQRVSGKLFIDDSGRPINFSTQRYREIQGTYSLETWSTPITAYAERAGLMLPVCGQAMWHLDSGPLTYIDLEIKNVEYNVDADNA